MLRYVSFNSAVDNTEHGRVSVKNTFLQNMDRLVNFLVEKVGVRVATARLYARQLVADGYIDVWSLRNVKDLSFVREPHRSKLLREIDAMRRVSPIKKRKPKKARPESAPVANAAPIVPKGEEVPRAQTQRARRRPAGIVMRPEHELEVGGGGEFDDEDDDDRFGPDSVVPYNLSDGGVLRMAEFVIGPEGKLSRDLLFLDELGRGAGGYVQRALHLPSGVIVAVKRISIDDDQRRRQMMLELRALHGLKGPTGQAARLDHGLLSPSSPTRKTCRRPEKEDEETNTRPPESRYVVDFFDTYVDPETSSLCLVLEYMNCGTLADFGEQDERVLSRVAFCVLSALRYIHSRRELHRDIKPSNILLNMCGEVKVSDYGCHRHFDEGLSLASTFTGTLAFMSPERVAGHDYSYASDIWSLGISLLTSALGENPFAKHRVYWDMAHAIRELPLPKLDPSKYSREFRHFLSRCLTKDPSKRLSAAQLLEHPFALAGRRNNISPAILARFAGATTEATSRARLNSMLSALRDALNRRTTGEAVDVDFEKMAAQLNVASDDLKEMYAKICCKEERRHRRRVPRKPATTEFSSAREISSSLEKIHCSAKVPPLTHTRRPSLSSDIETGEDDDDELRSRFSNARNKSYESLTSSLATVNSVRACVPPQTTVI